MIRHSRARVLPEPANPLPRRTKADPVAQAFGRAVQDVRRERDETLETVAHRMPMDAKYLGEIERGWHAPTVTTAKQIADALEVPLTRLVADL